MPELLGLYKRSFIKLNLLFNPEFLTERSANFDFINQGRFIIGSGDSHKSALGSELFVNLIR